MLIPPVLVEADTVNQRIALIGLSLNFAAASYGGARYTAAIEYSVMSNTYHLAVYKSTDSGATWTPLDIANAPASSHGAGFFSTGGTKIYFAYVPPSGGDGQTRVVAFNLTSDTWGVPSAPLAKRFSSDFWSAHDLSVLSDETYVVTAYTSAAPFPPGHNQPVLATYNSGSGWSAVTVIDDLITGAITQPRQALTPTDLVCIVWGGQYALGVNKSQAAVFAAGVLGAPNVVDATHENAYERGIYIGATDEYWFPGGHDGNSLVLTKGGPSANPTSWTTENPNGLNPSLYTPFLPLITKISDNDVFLVWNQTINNSTGERQINYIEQVNLGGWGTTHAVWNTITQPLTPPSTLPGDEELQSIGITDGYLDFRTALFQIYPIIGGFCGTIYYGDVLLIPPTLTLACPVSNAISAGVPYSGTLVRTGGTGPFVFAITAGALPPGFTLNTSTGAITGTTSAIGSWTYTAEVTDSLGAKAHITCTFVVGGGASGGSPCAAATSSPDTDNQFELTRVVATMKPAARLPVRGRST